MKFLLLRPQAKYRTSAAKMADAGIPAVGLALIETVPDNEVLARLRDMVCGAPAESLAIFVSTTAAQLAMQQMGQWPSQIKVLAVGAGTADILSAGGVQAGFPVDANTEGLLAMPELSSVQGKRIFIFKGVAGREDLAAELKARGALLKSIDLYKRERLLQPESSEPWQKSHIQCIIATSGELVEAAFAQLDNNWLRATPWILVSQRVADIATGLGVMQSSVSKNASDQALIESARKFLES